MLKVESLEAFVIDLPFRFAFKHSLASRNHSENLIVKVRTTDGSKSYTGYGEGIPRDYVTGESVQKSLLLLREIIFPLFKERRLESKEHLLQMLEQEFLTLGFDVRPAGAAWCALELALLDAWGQFVGQSAVEFLGGPSQDHRNGCIRYGGVIPFAKERTVAGVLWFYKIFGFETIKLKVGRDDDSTVRLLRLARSILGPDVRLRIDVNCAWTAEQTLRMAEKMRPYRITSIEQPVPAEHWDDLASITAALPEQVMVDESLCTIEQANLLAERRICSAFNIRLSKVGGIIAATKIVKIAKRAKLAVQLGAQVGESGILSAAGRAFALINEAFENYEGSNNFFLLKKDITLENLNVGFRGFGKALTNPGLGVKVQEQRVQNMSRLPEANSEEFVVSNR
jgi:muconate cycloisomerase